MNRLDEMHRLDRNRRDTPLRTLAGMDATRDIHLGKHPTAEDIARSDLHPQAWRAFVS